MPRVIKEAAVRRAESAGRLAPRRRAYGAWITAFPPSPGAGDQRVTYLELNERANQMAHCLRQAGVGRGTFVAILLERGVDFITAMLATFKAGAAYVPVDPNYPPDRVEYLLSNC